jgi:hypothetical protein
MVTNGGRLYVYSGATNGVGTNYGFLVSISSAIQIGSGSRLYARSYGADGGSPLFTANNVMIETNGFLDAGAGGYALQNGPGKSPYGGTYPAGSGYGGKGGSSVDALWGGSTYGSLSLPTDPGSAGITHPSHTYASGIGGGLIRLLVSGAVMVRGTITADGGAGLDACSGGGSGGAIFIRCTTLGGTGDGLLSARGGNASQPLYAGGGGGGRIALDYQNLAVEHGFRFAAAPAAVSWA